MPSSEKTPTLGLNRWRGTDIPMREDFVSDNNILDAAIATLQAGGGGSGGGGNDPRLDIHIADGEVHLSAEDREALGAASGPVIGSYTGNGSTSQIIVVGFRPRYGFVFSPGRPLVNPGSSGLFQRTQAGFVTNAGSSRGLEMSSAGFIAMQSPDSTSPGVDLHGLNQSGVRYVYVMWQ